VFKDEEITACSSLRSKLALIIAALVFGAAAYADDDHKKARRLLDAGKILPLETILDKTSELHPAARVIETEFEEKWNRYVYEVELVDNKGVVWEVEFDAATGAVLSNEEDD
jgi:uncharacterized membrane protein YkoI